MRPCESLSSREGSLHGLSVRCFASECEFQLSGLRSLFLIRLQQREEIAVVATTKDYGLGDFDFPRGWFMIAEASELGEAPLPLRFFGKDFALFRGASGRLVLLDAHCSHMGAHLAASTSSSLVVHGEQIVGDTIRCPYHGWRFNHEGEVDDIPDYDGPCPKAAKLGSYRVQEVMGAIVMWHDPEGGDPDFDFPALPEWEALNWVNGAYDHLGCLDIHPQEILDNMADSNHLGPTHGSPCEYFENEFEGHLYFQRQGGFRREYDAFLMTCTWYTGPGLLISRQGIGDIRSIEFIFHTPVEDGVTKVWHNNLLMTVSEVLGDDDRARAKAVQNEVLAAFEQDFDIWRNKKPAVRIMGLPTERNFQLGRMWYRQFYNPRARVEDFRRRANGKHVPTHKERPPQASLELENG